MQSQYVLAVEDDKFCQEALKMILTALKVDFAIAGNGQEALDAYKKRPATLILMDLQMPVMDGFKASLAIREYEKSSKVGKAKIFAISGNDDDKTIKDCLAAGMDSLIKKPLKKDVIAKHL